MSRIGAPPLSLDAAELTIRTVENFLRSGYPFETVGGKPSARSMAARELGINTQTLGHRLVVAKREYGLEADETAYRPKQYLHRPPGAPVIPDQSFLVEDEPEGDPVTVCVIGDAHDAPHLRDKSRFRWLGQFAAEHGVDHVVQVGDWWTMDCFSTHTDRATFEGLAKPTFTQDLESFHESQRAFHEGMSGHKAKRDCTLGNHEARAWKWDNLHPEAESHGHKVDEAFAQWGWRTTPYGQFRFIGGAGFVHMPLGAIGRPVSAPQRATTAMVDTIHGDDHRATQSVAFKAGPFRSPTVYSAGTALPPGFIEGFARNGGSTWRSGVCLATIWGGYVRRWSFEEMILLRRRYGRAGEGEPKTFTGWAA